MTSSFVTRIKKKGTKHDFIHVNVEFPIFILIYPKNSLALLRLFCLLYLRIFF